MILWEASVSIVIVYLNECAREEFHYFLNGGSHFNQAMGEILHTDTCS